MSISVLSLPVRILGTQLPGMSCPPHEGIHVALQVGRSHVGIVRGDAPSATWETELLIDRAGRIAGPAVHGRGDERFFYLAWLARGPGGALTMFRRAKLLFDGIPEEVWAATRGRGGLLEAELGLTDACGMPVCAAVRPPLITWRARAGGVDSGRL